MGFNVETTARVASSCGRKLQSAKAYFLRNFLISSLKSVINTATIAMAILRYSIMDSFGCNPPQAQLNSQKKSSTSKRSRALLQPKVLQTFFNPLALWIEKLYHKNQIKGKE